MNLILRWTIYFGRKNTYINDERILHEINQAKGKVLYYITIVVFLVFLLKILLKTFTIQNSYVELYILALSLITHFVRFTIFNQITDERM